LARGVVDTFLNATSVDELHAEFVARGATVRMPPTDQTWGNRELGIRDPDGNVLVFGQARARKGSENANQ
jgi:uncharacterized glyoxalase superfamily protein PhnB